MTEQLLSRIESVPLRELTGGDVEIATFELFGSWGNIEICKYLLPRLLELIATEGAIGNPPGGITVAQSFLGRLLSDGQFHIWPKEEQMAVVNFAKQMWLLFLYGDHPDYVKIFFPSLAPIVGQEWLLTEWISAETETAVESLISYINFHYSSTILKHKKATNAFLAALKLSALLKVGDKLRQLAQTSDFLTVPLREDCAVAAEQIELMVRHFKLV